MRAIALCFKPYLKQEEAMIYCNLGRTQFAVRSQEAGVYKNENGYYSREDLDKMCIGEANFEEMREEFQKLSKVRRK